MVLDIFWKFNKLMKSIGGLYKESLQCVIALGFVFSTIVVCKDFRHHHVDFKKFVEGLALVSASTVAFALWPITVPYVMYRRWSNGT